MTRRNHWNLPNSDPKRKTHQKNGQRTPSQKQKQKAFPLISDKVRKQCLDMPPLGLGDSFVHFPTRPYHPFNAMRIFTAIARSRNAQERAREREREPNREKTDDPDKPDNETPTPTCPLARNCWVFTRKQQKAGSQTNPPLVCKSAH